MDNAITLVESYLRVNGYFTLREYPILERPENGPVRVSTDIDLMAFRPDVTPGTLKQWPENHFTLQDLAVPDASLDCPESGPDLILAEVKEGVAEFNEGSRRQEIVGSILRRFGCCSTKVARKLSQDLLANGHTETPAGINVRLIAFGSSTKNRRAQRYHKISLGQVIGFMERHVDENWDVFRHVDLKDPILDLLALRKKSG